MTRLQRTAAAALAGLTSTLAVLSSPLVAVPPVVPPYVPIDVRWLALPIGFALVQFAAEGLAWPGPATTVLGLTVLAGVGANLHASQVLAFLGVPWASGGTAIPLVALAGSLAGICLGLWIAFDRAHERFREQAIERGVPVERLEAVTPTARATAREAIAVAALAVAGLGLTVRLAGRAVADTALPLPEVGAILVVLAAGALLLGVPRLRAAG